MADLLPTQWATPESADLAIVSRGAATYDDVKKSTAASIEAQYEHL
jgi:hypothetical protein